MTSLAKFGASCDDLLESILVLLDRFLPSPLFNFTPEPLLPLAPRCLMDGDDEVRDRALLYLEILKQKQKALASRYILSGDCHMITHTSHVIVNWCLSYRSSSVCSWSGAVSNAVL